MLLAHHFTAPRPLDLSIARQSCQTSSMRLHFQLQGEGRPLIILHGFLGSLENWQAMGKRLAALYQVYSVDLRNHGRSPHSEAMDYPVMAQDVRQFIAEHELAPPAVLGHSMGGKVAMQLATQYPREIEKLIVVDIAPKPYPPVHRPMLMAMRAADLHACKSFGEAGNALGVAIPDPTVRQFIMKNLTRDGAGEFHWRIGLDEIIGNYDRIIAPIATEKPFIKPACFIRAGLSNFIQDSDLAPIREAFPRAEFHLIAPAGHWAHIDAADEFHAVVRNFLSPPAS
jgi:pimeloyl-ACP methyl ester carboxylesterase